MRINRDFAYCIGSSSKKCKTCKRHIDKKIDKNLWYISPVSYPCKEYIKKD